MVGGFLLTLDGCWTQDIVHNPKKMACRRNTIRQLHCTSIDHLLMSSMARNCLGTSHSTQSHHHNSYTILSLNHIQARIIHKHSMIYIFAFSLLHTTPHQHYPIPSHPTLCYPQPRYYAQLPPLCSISTTRRDKPVSRQENPKQIYTSDIHFENHNLHLQLNLCQNIHTNQKRERERVCTQHSTLSFPQTPPATKG